VWVIQLRRKLNLTDESPPQNLTGNTGIENLDSDLASGAVFFRQKDNRHAT